MVCVGGCLCVCVCENTTDMPPSGMLFNLAFDSASVS